MNKIIAKAALLMMAVAFVALGTFSCRKEAPTVAKIKVVDTSGAAFVNAMVRLYPSPTIDEHGAIIVDDTMFTGTDGYATFDYTDMFNLGQAGFAVLDIEVRSGDTMAGSGLIKVVPEETSEEKVIIQ